MNKIQQAHAAAARVKAAAEQVVKHGLPPAERAKPADPTPPASPTTGDKTFDDFEREWQKYYHEKLAAEREENDALTAARARTVELERAIAEHHAQKADDRCIEDDDRLYAAAGLPPCDRRVGDKTAMLANCRRFIERRCEGGGWPSYVELKQEVERLTNILDAVCPSPDSGGGTVSVADQLAAPAEQIAGLTEAIWGEPSPDMSYEETRRQAVDHRVAFDADKPDPALAAVSARGPKVPDSHPMAPFYNAFPSETTRGPTPAPEPDAKDRRIAELEDFARDCATNWDCDADAHRYRTRCRACQAAELLGGKQVDGIYVPPKP